MPKENHPAPTHYLMSNYRATGRTEDARIDTLPRPAGPVIGPGKRQKKLGRRNQSDQFGLIGLRKNYSPSLKLGLKT